MYTRVALGLAVVVIWCGGCTNPHRKGSAKTWPQSTVFESRSAANTLRVCSFNIKFLGSYKGKDNEALANLLQGYDVVVVQELIAPPVATPGDTTRSRAKRFFDAMAVHGFRYVLSESDTGQSSLGSYTTTTEWFVTFYKPDRVRPATDLPNGFIAQPVERNSSFKRVPYATGFQTLVGNFDFVLISVHLDPEDKVYRAQEFKAIDAWLQRQLGAQSERDLIVLGDCNIQTKTELSSVTPDGFISLNADCVRTNVALGSAKPYDHVFFHPQYTSEMDRTYGFKVINLVAAVQPGLPLTSEAQNKFFAAYSDHHPVVFTLKIPVRDDD